MPLKKICGHASKAKSKARHRIKKQISVLDLDPESINIGKIIGNVAGTQYIVEDILNKSICHTHARSNVRAYRLPTATLVAYSLMRSSFDSKINKVRNIGEIIKVINEDEYDELTEHFPKISKDMIYLSLDKLNISSNMTIHKSLYDIEDDIIYEENSLSNDESNDQYNDESNDYDADDNSTEDNKNLTIDEQIEINKIKKKEEKELRKTRAIKRNLKYNNNRLINLHENNSEEDINLNDL